MQPLTKRQREILDYLNEFIQQHGYAPSLEEIGRKFALSSLATVHKHLTNLQEKGFIRRAWNRSRSVELLSSRAAGRAVEVPLLGYVAAGMPIEALESDRTLPVPAALLGAGEHYALEESGDSMIEAGILDGDFALVKKTDTARDGEIVVALVRDEEATLKYLRRENGMIRLDPANASYDPQFYRPEEVQVQGKLAGLLRRYH